MDGASATLSALLSVETTLTANQKAFEAERDGYTQAKQGYEGINTALAGARDTARQAAAAAAKQGVLDSVNALLAQMGRPAVGTYKEAAAVYAQLQQTQPGLPALPDPAVVGEQAAAAVPANVDALLALDDASFEAWAQAGALPGGEQHRADKESRPQLRDAALEGGRAPARGGGGAFQHYHAPRCNFRHEACAGGKPEKGTGCLCRAGKGQDDGGKRAHQG
ncbi:MAG: hypothetical protein ACLR7U_10070 [Ruthenibacterium lactatiformans]